MANSGYIAAGTWPMDQINPVQGVGKPIRSMETIYNKPGSFLIVGPPGHGKKHALLQVVKAAGNDLILYDLAHISNESGAINGDFDRLLCRYYKSTNLNTGTHNVLALYGAEHLRVDQLEAIKNKKNHTYSQQQDTFAQPIL